jgi:hypothetical protein
MSSDRALRTLNRTMIAFDLVLGAGALVAPDATLRLLGHDPPSDDARAIFRRCGPIWLTFAAAHATAARRGEPGDWWAVAWLRSTELLTDVVWSTSPAVRSPAAKVALWGAGAANLAMTIGFGRLARR